MKPRKSSELGLRARRKLERRQRIRAAARELFSRHGYETATVRQIARRAHVGLGTLFNYAQDKRDLVFLMFNEELAAVADDALKSSRTKTLLLDQLLGLCRPHYQFFARDPALSRILLKDMAFYSEGKQAAEYQRIRGRLLSGIEDLVRAAQRDRQIGSEEDARRIARLTFFVFAGALRWWIASRRPDPVRGLAELKRLFRVQIDGLRSRSAPAKKSTRHTRGGVSVPR